jgi:hypothetical protein
MNTFRFIESVCGLIALYVGVRCIVVRKVPVVSEGGYVPLTWLKGWEAVVLGLAALFVGATLLAAAFGFVELFR